MARIRSIHPGLFTDEAFATLSSDAQMLLIGIWTEADDRGVFEWKPLTLRMRLRPAKDGAIEPFLDEIVAANSVKRFEVDGKSYGAIRNFRKWQRPEKPKVRFPLPDELLSYVHLSPTDPQPVADNSPNAQAEEGGRREVEEEGDKQTAPAAHDDGFEDFWEACPKKVGKGSAEVAYRSALKNQDAPSPAQLLAAMKAYGAKVLREKTEAKFIKQPAFWIQEKRWLDADLVVPAVVDPGVFVAEGSPAWMAWAKAQGGPTPTFERRTDRGIVKGWFFPSEFPPASKGDVSQGTVGRA